MATIKQERAFKEVVEKGRPVSKAMVDVGYSKNTAVAPSKLTRSKGWKELVDKYIPEKDLLRKHKELLNQKKLDYFVFPKAMTDEEIQEHVESAGLEMIVIKHSDKGKLAFYSINDAMSQQKAVDMAYKLKGSYADTDKGGNKILIVNVSGETTKRYDLQAS